MGNLRQKYTDEEWDELQRKAREEVEFTASLTSNPITMQSTIEKPSHYADLKIDTFTRMEANCTLEEKLAFVNGNIDKYTWRKKGQDKSDYEKIINYAKWAIEQIDKELK